ncbi:MAG: clostripain-related cysteine peptidase [Eubacteriales bacterium]|nr:clostripain-related cysteine peptidase [Eubacteriales bacterium]
MDNNRPRSREKRVTDNSAGVHRRGSGLGTGPVGSPQNNSNKPGRSGGSGGGSPLGIIIALIVVLLGGGGGAATLLGGSGSGSDQAYTAQQETGNTQGTAYSQNTSGNTDTGSTVASAAQQPDLSVAEGSRARYTEIKGDGSDVTTIMVYMCGTDLESRSGMASNDLKEMANASYGDNVNVVVYTGGCKGWKISGISNQVNQIYQVKGGKLITLESDMGNKTMTDPATLTEFINYCKTNFPANRNDLILWDHGGGSVTGYGYDEKKASAGAMNLAGISKALSNAGMKFDFIGFDACLMACAENAKMLDAYADYMIASEETEPGIGWYYTTWLNAYGKDPSMDTVSLGKVIIDSFVEECNARCRGQKTTLSIVDLAEFSNTVPDKLKSFSRETADLIKNDQYQQVATARQGSREFAVSSKIDQVDLVDLANRMNTESSEELIQAVRGAVKYNRTASNMDRAYGVSIYFPNKKLSTVDQAIAINNAIGLDDEYNSCIREYASLQASGQAVAGGMGNSGSPFEMLLGNGSSSGTAGNDMTMQILEQLLGNGLGSLVGTDGTADFFSGRSLGTEETAVYIAEHQLDASKLIWENASDGSVSMSLPEEQWALVTDVAMNMFYDDGEGYVDLGLDNTFSFDEDGKLVPETDKTWLAINGQPVAYYYEGTVEDGDKYTITGHVPAMLNGSRVNLLLVFDQDHPYGYIAGSVSDYVNGETAAAAKADGELQAGDKLEFLCDFYSYDGTYQDSYYLGEPMTVTDTMEISNVAVGEGNVRITYKFTDIYNNEYWTPVIEK